MRAPDTRERLIEAAHGSVLQRGFAATTVEQILTATGASKGSFFHHFPSKAALGDALVERFARADHELLQEVTARARRFSSDPVQRLMIVVGLLIERSEPEDELPGCLFAAFLYEQDLASPASRALIAESMLAWRVALAQMIDEALEVRRPALPVDPEALADGLLAITEGAYVLARAVDDPTVVTRQLELYRDHLALVFGGLGRRGDGCARDAAAHRHHVDTRMDPARR